MQPCNLHVCEAAAIQKEMQMAVIMNIAALKLCCKETTEDQCHVAARPQTLTAAGEHATADSVCVLISGADAERCAYAT